MVTHRFTGRKGKLKTNTKVEPSLRFRRRQAEAPAGSLAKKRTAGSKRLFFSLFTPAGFAIFLSSVLIFIALLWFFVFSTTFLVREVSVVGPTLLTRDKVTQAFYELQDQRIAWLVPANHIAVLSKARLEQVLRSRYPEFDRIISYREHWPDSISFVAQDRVPEFLYLQSTGRAFLLDAEGIAIAESAPDATGLVTIESNSQAEVKLGQAAGNNHVLQFARDFQKNWPASLDFRPVRYKVGQNEDGRDLEIYTNEGWLIQADSQDNPATVTANLAVVIDKEINTIEKRQNLAYIYLRLSSRAYYCLKSQACAR